MDNARNNLGRLSNHELSIKSEVKKNYSYTVFQAIINNCLAGLQVNQNSLKKETQSH